MPAGYDEKLDVYYDEKYQFGNAVSYMIAPKLSKEELDKVLKNLEDFIGNLSNAKCKITHPKWRA